MTITINDKNHIAPDSWNDLTLEQQLTAYQIIMGNIPKDFTLDEALPIKRIELARYLLGLSEAFMDEWEADCIKVEGEEEGKLIFHSEFKIVVEAATKFAFEKLPSGEGEAEQYALNFTLTKCPWTHMDRAKKGKSRGRKKVRYYAPADELANITLYEMAQTFTLFELWLEDKDPDRIDRLIAILYREGKKKSTKNKQARFGGDRRLPLLGYEAAIDYRQKNMAKLTEPIKQLIVFWFASCRQAIIEENKNIFSTPEEGVEKAGNDYAWGGVLMELAGGIVHLNEVSAYKYSTGLTYLGYLEDKRKLAERNRAKQTV